MVRAPAKRPLRIFVAIFPPTEIQETLLNTARGIVIEGNVRWVRPENAHLTLKFLGDIEKEALQDVHTALGEVARRHTPFSVQFSGLGAFPSHERGRVLWAGVDRGSPELTSLARGIQDSFETLGFEREGRAYKPHATLGRARGRPVKLPDNAEIHSPEFTARGLDLVESVLGEKGATYEKLESYPFYLKTPE